MPPPARTGPPGVWGLVWGGRALPSPPGPRVGTRAVWKGGGREFDRRTPSTAQPHEPAMDQIPRKSTLFPGGEEQEQEVSGIRRRIQYLCPNKLLGKLGDPGLVMVKKSASGLTLWYACYELAWCCLLLETAQDSRRWRVPTTTPACLWRWCRTLQIRGGVYLKFTVCKKAGEGGRLGTTTPLFVGRNRYKVTTCVERKKQHDTSSSLLKSDFVVASDGDVAHPRQSGVPALLNHLKIAHLDAADGEVRDFKLHLNGRFARSGNAILVRC